MQAQVSLTLQPVSALKPPPPRHPSCQTGTFDSTTGQCVATAYHLHVHQDIHLPEYWVPRTFHNVNP